jgi:4-hydroxybenzoyl-CoA thioesterase/acyl-CoA thioester hydrolase
MAQHFHLQRRVEFRDTDAAGIAHFSVFFVYMEEAEHALLRHLGLSVHTTDGDGAITWPRVAARCDFQSAARFEDVLDVEVRVVRIGRKSITYEFHFALDDRIIATGEVTAVCCRIQNDGQFKSISIPPAIAQCFAALKAS